MFLKIDSIQQDLLSTLLEQENSELFARIESLIQENNPTKNGGLLDDLNADMYYIQTILDQLNN